MQLELDDDEKHALLNLLTSPIDADQFPVSPRVQVLRRIFAKFGRIGPQPPAPVGRRPAAARADRCSRAAGAEKNCYVPIIAARAKSIG